MPFPPTLSKTDYNRFLQCPKLLWLQKRRKDLAKPVTETTQALFDQGYLVEEYAHKLFPGGVEVKGWYKKGREETQQHIREGRTTIFQANAMTKNLYSKADIIHFNEQTQKWDLYEVKSSTQVKEEHIPDLAFQKITLERDGIPIGKTYLIHINREYVRQGEIDPKELLTIEDLTEEVENIRQITETQIPKALEIITLKEEVDKKIGKQCDNPYECPFKEYCWKNLPEYSIFDLQRISEQQITQLRALGIEKITDIPDDFEMNQKQENQVVATKTDKDFIDSQSIENALEELEYPLYFLDYETYGSAIPLFEGLRPYQQMPFQYSLHVIRSKGERCEHYEYLHTGKDIPIPALVEDMKKNIGNKGSVIVWYKGFEMKRNEEMAGMYPQYADFLESVNSRVFDLMEIFSNQYYISPRFKGSASIKKVLPVVVPELSYSDLEDVQEGQIASLYWFKHVYGESGDKERVVRNLLEYCKLDTLAMVEVWRKLGEVL